jgi:hypothetical protein
LTQPTAPNLNHTRERACHSKNSRTPSRLDTASCQGKNLTDQKRVSGSVFVYCRLEQQGGNHASVFRCSRSRVFHPERRDRLFRFDDTGQRYSTTARLHETGYGRQRCRIPRYRHWRARQWGARCGTNSRIAAAIHEGLSYWCSRRRCGLSRCPGGRFRLSRTGRDSERQSRSIGRSGR